MAAIKRSIKSALTKAGTPRKSPAKTGRPPYEPTDKDRTQVKAMAGYRINHNNIALLIGVSKPTLHKHFRHELDVGMATADATVIEGLHKNARNGNVSAQIWWTKTQCGWHETIVQKHGGDEDSPPIRLDLSGMTKDEREQFRTLLHRRDTESESGD